MKNPKDKILFSTSEVAKLLGVNRVTVFRKIVAGKIQAEKVGKTYLITKTEITRYLKRGASR